MITKFSDLNMNAAPSTTLAPRATEGNTPSYWMESSQVGFTLLRPEIPHCPGWCGSVDWVWPCKPKGRQFDSQSGHMPGFQARSAVGGMWEAPTHWFFSSFLSLSFSLKINKILKKKEKKKSIHSLKKESSDLWNLSHKVQFTFWAPHKQGYHKPEISHLFPCNSQHKAYGYFINLLSV